MPTVMDRFEMDGKVAFVTGAASGIGEQFSIALAEAGADVVLADLDEEGVAETAEEIEEETETGATTLPMEVDVSDKEQVDAAVETTVDEFGRLDAAFANAGVAELEAPVSGYSENQWRRTMDVNLDGVFYTDRASAEVMVEQDGGGSIVNTASIYGLRASPLAGTAFAYATSKGGVVNMTRALAAEVASEGVRVNAIAPSHIRTDLAGGFLREDASETMREIQDEVKERTPMGRIADPEELKGIAVFLASDASAFCTGYTYAVDGGWLAV